MSYGLALTGHRPDKLGGYRKGREPTRMELNVKNSIREKFEEEEPDYAIIGMAQGVDTLGAEACVEISLPFDAYIPFEGQDRVWPMFARTRYTNLLYKARKVVIVSKKLPRTKQEAARFMDDRNHRMVDVGRKLLAVWNGDTYGGTYNCYRYAVRVGKPIIRIDPRELWEALH